MMKSSFYKISIYVLIVKILYAIRVYIAVLVYFSEDTTQHSSKKELIDTAKLIAISSKNVAKLAQEVAEQCPDKRLRQVGKIQ